MQRLVVFILYFSSIYETFANDLGRGWPKLVISNDGTDIRLAEPNIATTNSTAGSGKRGNGTRDDYYLPTYHLNTLYKYVDYGSPFDVAVEERKMFFVRHGTRKAGGGGGLSGDTLVAADMDHPEKPQRILLKNFFPASDGIAVDWVTKKLYLYDADTHRIEVLDYGPRGETDDDEDAKPMVTVLIYKDLFVRSLVVDPVNGYMFWLNDYSGPTIERAWMDGTRRTVLVRDLNFGYPNSLSVDSENNRIYWTVDNDGIWSAAIDGSDKRKVIAGLRRPYSVATYKNLLMWGDVDDYNPGVYYCDKAHCSKGELLIDDLTPYTLRIFDQKRQPSVSNPCAFRNGNCSHLCLITPEMPLRRSCACPIGVSMLDDGLTCNSGAEEVIITAQRYSVRVISLDTPDFTDRRIPIDRIKHAVAVDYDPIEGYVYWLDTLLEMIRRVKLDGSGEEDVVVGVSPSCEDIAVDWIAKNIYWTDAGAGRIEVARIGQQSARRILLSSDVYKPRAIVVDPPRGYIFWTDLKDDSPRIQKAFLDGSNPTVLVQLAEGDWPNGLALDAEEGHIYWVEAKSDTLERANAADGSDRISLGEYESSHAWGVTILGKYVYWSDMQHRSLERVSKFNDGERIRLTDHLTDIMRIKGVNLKHAPTDTNQCAFSNGGCSHLCFYRPTGRICMCPLGWELSLDGSRCLVPDGYLVFTRNRVHDIMIASLSSSPTRLDYLRLHNVSQPFSLDFYYKQQRLYWTGYEGDKRVISRAYFNGSNVEQVVDYGIGEGESLAIDWIAEQMYWSDAIYNHIEMSRLNGQSRRIIVWNDTGPGPLAVSPISGHLYWVNLKHSLTTIERSDLDGQNRATFLSVVGRISSLALDHSAQRLYWAIAAAGGTIRFADLNRQWDSRVLVQEKSMQPYGLTLFGDHLYWADWHKQTIQMCDKSTGSNATILYPNQHLVKGLTAIHPSKQEGWNGCSNGAKKCEHLCFAVTNAVHQPGFRCDCPTHYTLANDGRTCIAPSNFVLIVQGTLLLRFQTYEHSLNGPIATLPLNNLSNVASLKYDPISRLIYWMQKTNKTSVVMRAHDLISRGKVETLKFLPNVDVVDFSLDPTTQSIFWISVPAVVGNSVAASAHSNPAVHVSKFVDGRLHYLGQVVSDEAFSPRSIAIDPLRGSLFFVDAKKKSSSIVRCNLDGTECAMLLPPIENEEIELLIVDLLDGALFWYNKNRRAISRMNKDGTNYQPDFAVGHLNNAILAMTPFKRRLYFVDAKTHTIASVDKLRGYADSKPLSSYRRVTDVRAILAVDEAVSKRLKSSDACARAKCTHICYLGPAASAFSDDSSGRTTAEWEAKCGCPVGKKLQIGHNSENECIERPECQENEWHCGEGVCIGRQLVCNGVVDCVNGGSDEKNCTCQSGQFTCHNGSVKCVRFALLCDGTDHCMDGSDEKVCPPSLLLETDRGVNTSNRNPHHHRNHSSSADSAGWNAALNVVISVVVVALVAACLVYVAMRWCRRWCCARGRKLQHGIRATTDGTTVEFHLPHPAAVAMQRPGASSGGGNGPTATTVEYSATCRVIHHVPSAESSNRSSISPLPPPLPDSDERPRLTGKSSSSSDAAASSVISGVCAPPMKNPPPSLATVSRSSHSPDSAQYDYERRDNTNNNNNSARRQQHQQQQRTSRRRRRAYEQRDDDPDSSLELVVPAAACVRRALPYAAYFPPPPPYAACVRDYGADDGAGVSGVPSNNMPLLHHRSVATDSSDDRMPPANLRPSTRPKAAAGRRRTASKNRRLKNGAAACGSGIRPPPSSPRRRRYEENPPPPPTPVPPSDIDDDAESDLADTDMVDDERRRR